MQGKKQVFEDLSSRVIGAAIEVHRALGAGYQESVYANALSIALTERRIPHVREHEVDLYFHGSHVGKHRLDLLVDNTIVVELKAVERVLELHKAQLRSYLRSTRKEVGLLLNFDGPVLDVKRSVNTITHK